MASTLSAASPRTPKYNSPSNLIAHVLENNPALCKDLIEVTGKNTATIVHNLVLKAAKKHLADYLKSEAGKKQLSETIEKRKIKLLKTEEVPLILNISQIHRSPPPLLPSINTHKIRRASVNQ